MTRQCIYSLLTYLPQKQIILPRFVPAGVYKPAFKTGKHIIYYDLPTTLKINPDQIDSISADPSDTIFYHIHQFGMYIPQNIALAKAMKKRGYYVIDDRSLTLPVDTYDEFGNATAYSFYKLVGLPYGGQIRSASVPSSSDEPPSILQSSLMKQMNRNMRFYVNPLIRSLPQLPYRILNRFAAGLLYYDTEVEGSMTETLYPLPLQYQKRLFGIDFGAVTSKRVATAQQYYESIRSEYLLPVDRDAVSYQSLMGFPILVSDPLAALKYLIRKGIITFRFTKIWWWDTTSEPCELYKHNILLPVHQHLRDKDIRYIIEIVNTMPYSPY